MPRYSYANLPAGRSARLETELEAQLSQLPVDYDWSARRVMAEGTERAFIVVLSVGGGAGTDPSFEAGYIDSLESSGGSFEEVEVGGEDVYQATFQGLHLRSWLTDEGVGITVYAYNDADADQITQEFIEASR